MLPCRPWSTALYPAWPELSPLSCEPATDCLPAPERALGVLLLLLLMSAFVCGARGHSLSTLLLEPSPGTCCSWGLCALRPLHSVPWKRRQACSFPLGYSTLETFTLS